MRGSFFVFASVTSFTFWSIQAIAQTAVVDVPEPGSVNAAADL